MKLKTYICLNCKEEFASRRNPNAKYSNDRPMCQKCGVRIND